MCWEGKGAVASGRGKKKVICVGETRGGARGGTIA